MNESESIAEFNNKLGDLIKEASKNVPRTHMVGILEGAKFYLLAPSTMR